MSRTTSDRCDDVARALAEGGHGLDARELASHLDACPRCAAAARSLRRLEQTWALTRPAEPGDATWRALWDRVESAVDAPPALLSMTHRPRRARWGAVWAIAAVAQAAAVLLAANLFWPRTPERTTVVAAGSASPAPVAQPAPPSPAPSVVQVEYELEEGQTLFLVLGRRGGALIVKPRFVSTAELVAFDGGTADPYASAAQMDFVVLNVMEGME